MPVHLGSMPLSVKAAIENRQIGPGDVIILNDPYKGGRNLRISRWSPAFFPKASCCFTLPAARHHFGRRRNDPGSMPLAEEIYQEGLRYHPLN